MKIENVSNAETGFKPIVIKITIESKKEYIAILDMACLDISIPNLLDNKHKKYIKEFLGKFKNAI